MTEQQAAFTEEPNEQPQIELSENNSAVNNFLLGAFFGCLPAGVGLDLSSYMTHTPLLEYAVWQLAIAAGIPLFTGLLGIALKGKFLKTLGDVMSTTIV